MQTVQKTQNDKPPFRKKNRETSQKQLDFDLAKLKSNE